MADIAHFLVGPQTTLKEAMEVIDRGGKRACFVVNEEGRLIGAVTDGDMRRAILAGKGFETEIQLIMNHNCTFVTENYSQILIESLFKDKRILQIPVIDEYMRIKDIIFYSDFYNKNQRNNKAVIMAGGLGSRLSPLTDDIPKPMLKVGDKPILEIIIGQLKHHGFTDIVICLNYKAEIIESYFQDGSDFGVRIQYVREHQRMGTAGALKLVESMLSESFLVLNGDILTKLNLDQFITYHMDNKYDITIGSKNISMEIPYGVLELNEGSVLNIDEKPQLNYYISGGIYCMDPKVLAHIPPNQYFDMNELIQEAIGNQDKVMSYPITEYWMDIGHHEDYYRANKDVLELF